jgi:hypothetical protein
MLLIAGMHNTARDVPCFASRQGLAGKRIDDPRHNIHKESTAFF